MGGMSSRGAAAVYTAHCGKCHRMRGNGGDVGPALDRQGSLASVLPTPQLRDYVRQDESRFPHSGLPPSRYREHVEHAGELARGAPS